LGGLAVHLHGAGVAKHVLLDGARHDLGSDGSVCL
jgi:hypothetical protein